MKSLKMTEGATVVAILFSLGALSLLHAVHVKSEPGEGNRPAQEGKMEKLGEIERGPRGKNEIALTFDAGAEAECFADLITALANAHASSTFFITGRFVHDHPGCAAEITKHCHEVGTYMEPSQFDSAIR